MVRLEEKEYERAVAEGSSCFAVPVEVSDFGDGLDTDVLTYRITKAAAEEYHSRFASCPFSDEAKDFLKERLAPAMESLGYIPVFEPFKFRKEFEFEPGGAVSARIGDCVIIDRLKDYVFDEELPVEEYELFSDVPTDRMAVLIEDGKVVCFAGVNDMSEGGAIEINVECAPGYRRRGYASACAEKLARYLSDMGEKVVYVCSDRNTASEKTALRAGFRYTKTVMSFVCMKQKCDGGPEGTYGI